MARTGRSWAQVVERIGWLLLVAIAAAIVWLLVLRAFRALLTALGG